MAASAWPFCIRALLKWYVGNVPFVKDGFALSPRRVKQRDDIVSPHGTVPNPAD